MEKEAGEYVAACTVCAGNKVSHRSPPSLLHPLPVTSRPWSDIFFDFVTGLPPSEGNTTILMVEGRFSKMVHFIPLPKLPSVKQTTEVMLYHIFRIICLSLRPVLEGILSVCFPAKPGAGEWIVLSGGPEPCLLEQTSYFALPLVPCFYSLPLAINPPLIRHCSQLWSGARQLFPQSTSCKRMRDQCRMPAPS